MFQELFLHSFPTQATPASEVLLEHLLISVFRLRDLTLDLGGTNLRVCWVELQGRGQETKLTQDQFKLPSEIKTGDAEQLWNYVADSLQTFIEKHKITGTSERLIPFGFTFSYPASQQYIDHGVLQTWTKGLDIKGVEGEDAAAQLRQAMQRRKLPIELVALINDTTGECHQH